MIWLKDYITPYAINSITVISGIIGNCTGLFKILYTNSAIAINSEVNNILLQIDVECSGIIEILVFISIMLFFEVYTKLQRCILCIVGTLYLIFANAFRVTLISIAIYYKGYSVYNIMHSWIGRIIFYFLSIILYFYMFTKPQIKAMKVGDFKYE